MRDTIQVRLRKYIGHVTDIIIWREWADDMCAERDEAALYIDKLEDALRNLAVAHYANAFGDGEDAVADALIVAADVLPKEMSVQRTQVNNVEQSQVNRVGCRECGDEYWDRGIGDNCPNCGDPLVEISPNRDSKGDE